jgi:hypothetical protein
VTEINKGGSEHEGGENGGENGCPLTGTARIDKSELKLLVKLFMVVLEPITC